MNIEELRKSLHEAIDSIEDEEVLLDLVRDLDGKHEYLNDDFEALESVIRDSDLPGEYDTDEFSDKSASWIDVRKDDVVCTFIFNEDKRLESIGFYKDVTEVVREQEIIKFSK